MRRAEAAPAIAADSASPLRSPARAARLGCAISQSRVWQESRGDALCQSARARAEASAHCAGRAPNLEVTWAK